MHAIAEILLKSKFFQESEKEKRILLLIDKFSLDDSEFAYKLGLLEKKLNIMNKIEKENKKKIIQILRQQNNLEYFQLLKSYQELNENWNTMFKRFFYLIGFSSFFIGIYKVTNDLYTFSYSPYFLTHNLKNGYHYIFLGIITIIAFLINFRFKKNKKFLNEILYK